MFKNNILYFIFKPLINLIFPNTAVDSVFFSATIGIVGGATTTTTVAVTTTTAKMTAAAQESKVGLNVGGNIRMEGGGVGAEEMRAPADDVTRT